MFDSNENDPISPALRALLELFATELNEVRFPDVDAEVLDDAAAVVREKAELVAKAQAALEAARQALHESQDALLLKGQRALAYARVFSEDNAELSAKLEGISLPRATRKSPRAEGTAAEPVATAQGNDENAPKRRGRPPKVRPATGGTLFSDGATPEALAAAAHESGNGMLPTA
ncbi:hypothetical protein JY651_38825 [Pyxidicoccus parkwayensis]|uniref:Uncharacterized protein n=1 Tax=Pyxidicoccus parkwayensis TaxID=2813578 RepID=A0ABX7NQF5_9BACT|nr:hypothetical protein [Pyxidicoccus parkwaysis]QSQ21105.1 hypothetical protein JY651_38825 [Pyxidicoccus parkwaysis]